MKQLFISMLCCGIGVGMVYPAAARRRHHARHHAAVVPAVAIAAAPVQPALAGLGSIIYQSPPKYTILDPDAANNIVIIIDTSFVREYEKGGKVYQLSYRVERKLTYDRTAGSESLTDELKYVPSSVNLLTGGQPVKPPPAGAMGAGDLRYPKFVDNTIKLLGVDEAEFRQRFKNELPPRLDAWPLTASHVEVAVTRGSADQFTVTTTNFITRELAFYGHTYHIAYEEVKTEEFTYASNHLSTKKTGLALYNFRGETLKQDGHNLTFNDGSNVFSLPVPGREKDQALQLGGLPGNGNTPPALFLQSSQSTESIYFNKKDEYRRLYADYYWKYDRRPLFTLGLSYMPSYAFRTDRIVEQQYTHQTEGQLRNTTEEGRYGQIAELQAGLTLRRSHGLYASLLYFQGGFGQTNDPGGVNWHTGLNGAGGHEDYRIEQRGGGLGYSYTAYNQYRSVHGVLDFGLYYLENHNRYDGTRGNLMSVKVAAGFAIDPAYYWSVRLLPEIFYNISSYNKGSIIRTNLFNAGLNIGVVWRFIR